jgi:hypothetical protein
MGIKAKFNRNDVRKDIMAQKANIEGGIFQILAFVGEDFVSKARQALIIDSGLFSKGDYTDRTANLRGSIGYFILKDGRIVKRGLEGTSEGKSAAVSMISDAKKVENGFQLVGVAGMDYASYVEAMGYNVITSQAEVALVDLSSMLRSFAAKKGFSIDVSNGVVTAMR